MDSFSVVRSSKGVPIVLRSGDSARRSFCYLPDATLGIFTVPFNGQDGEAYNIADLRGESRIAELADSLAVEFKMDGITDERQVRSDQNYFMSSIDSFGHLEAGMLGWFPSHSIDQGFRRTFESYR